MNVISSCVRTEIQKFAGFESGAAEGAPIVPAIVPQSNLTIPVTYFDEDSDVDQIVHGN